MRRVRGGIHSLIRLGWMGGGIGLGMSVQIHCLFMIRLAYRLQFLTQTMLSLAGHGLRMTVIGPAISLALSLKEGAEGLNANGFQPMEMAAPLAAKDTGKSTNQARKVGLALIKWAVH